MTVLSKIAFIDLVFNYPPNGGASTDLFNIMKRARQDHDVKLFIPRHKKIRISSDFDLPFEYIDISYFEFNHKHYPEKLKKSIDRFYPDHVFIADGWYLKPHIVNCLKDYRPILRFYAYETLCLKSHGHFARLGKICKKNYFENSWDNLIDCKLCSFLWIMSNHNRVFLQEYINSKVFQPGYSDVVKKALANADRIIVYNKFTKDRMSPYNKNVDIVPSGIDIKLFKPNPTEKKNDKIVLLAFGRLDQWYKGLDTLIQSCDEIYRDRKDFVLKVTTSKQFKHPYIESTGWINHQALPELINGSDICIFPSLWEEPFGISIIEAMSCERPVIVSDAGALPEIVTENETGLVFQRNKPGDLKDKIISLIEDNALKSNLGQKARNVVSEKYSWDVIYNDYYRKIFK